MGARRRRLSLTRGAAVLGPLALPLVMTLVATQEVQQLREAAPMASITATRILSFEDSIGENPVPRLLEFRDGRIAVLGMERIWIYDRRGRFIRGLGRRGEGPGEFLSYLMGAVGPGDTLHVFDYRRRHTVLAPDGRTIRAKQLSFIPEENPIALPGGEILLTVRSADNGWVQDGKGWKREPILFGLAVVDAKRSRLIRRIGMTPASEDVDTVFRAQSCVAPNGTIWSPFSGRYRIEAWRSNGTRVKILERSRPEWWDRWDGSEIPPGHYRWHTRIIACAVDSASRLWILSDTPIPGATRLHTGMREGEAPRKDTSQATRLLDSLANGIVEVIDLKRGVVLASQRFPQRFAGFLGPGRVYHKSEDVETGETTLDVWQLDIQLK